MSEENLIQSKSSTYKLLGQLNNLNIQHMKYEQHKVL
jgi:hypothetical protein